jgi:asparagine synthase (glutamine-hydrolysing)
LFSPDLDSSIDAAKQTYTGLLTGHPLSFAVFHQAPWHHYGLLSLEETQVALRSPFLDNDFVRAVFRAPASATTSDETCLRLIAEGSPELLRIRTDHGLLSEHGPLVASGVQKWLEFTFKAEYAYDYGMPQWVTKADRALSALKLERLFLGRHKFYHFRIWYREALSPYIRETLMDSQSLSRPYIQKSTVERIVTAHLKGTGNFTTAIHKLLTLELLHRTLLDGQVETTGMSPTRDHATSFSEALAAAN